MLEACWEVFKISYEFFKALESVSNLLDPHLEFLKSLALSWRAPDKNNSPLISLHNKTDITLVITADLTIN